MDSSNLPSVPNQLWFGENTSMEHGEAFSTVSIAEAIQASLEEKEGDAFTHFEDHLFDTLCDENEKVSLGKFLADLNWMGLRTDDPRLKETIVKIKQIEKKLSLEKDDLMLSRETFADCITSNIMLIKKAFEAELIIPEFSKFCGIIHEIYEKCKKINFGQPSSHTPQLAKYNPNLWAVSICTIDGQRYSVGDVHSPFPLQSTVKPLAYALAINEHGPEFVHQHVGQEASGELFNMIKLDVNNKPHNPMINAGGLVVTSLLKTNEKMADRFDFVHSQFKKLAAGEYLGFHNAVYLSERETSNRNFALGHYLREYQCFPKGAKLKDTLDFYFQLASIEVCADSAAVIAATLANGGICPLTGEECLSGISVQNTLSLMYSCGMYDYSGEFAFKVGIPSKSSISGSIFLVIPNVMGICVWSPSLDKYNNSVRGIEFCKELVQNFNFHQYDSLLYQSDKIDPRQTKKKELGEMNTCLVIMAAHQGNLTALTRMFLSGSDLHIADYDGRTALHLACAEGHLDCVKFLLEKVNVPNSMKDRWNNTPLDEAKTFKRAAVIEYMEKYFSENNECSSPIKNVLAQS